MKLRSLQLHDLSLASCVELRSLQLHDLSLASCVELRSLQLEEASGFHQVVAVSALNICRTHGLNNNINKNVLWS